VPLEKDEILAEIRRCAEDNGGVPLGRERFYAATGIRESDWSGRYWTRWSDAVTEAGYAANTLNPSHLDDQLLGPLALLVRDLGRFPTSPELRMRRREDPSFPSHNTYARFGNKAALITRVRDFCATDSDLADVYAICAPLVADEIEPTVPEDTPATDGFVYLLKSGKYHKIGRANDAGRRAYEIRLQQPEPVIEVHTIRTDDPEGIERYWHRRFADRRANGEWFKLTSADVRAFKRRRFM
jgi:hypothetical protein